ncbi:lipocalin family protein [Arenimonas aestuarii]
MRRLALILPLLLLAACAATGGTMPPLTTDANINLERYMGRWWVIANVPYFAERGKLAAADVYTLRDDGRITNTYVYRKAFDEPEKSMNGVAEIVPGTNNAQWRIAFFWGLVKADYLVMEVAPDYSWALIGHPKRKLAWIFSRKPVMDEALYQDLRQRFAAWGYDPETILKVPQKPEQAGQPGFQ